MELYHPNDPNFVETYVEDGCEDEHSGNISYVKIDSAFGPDPKECVIIFSCNSLRWYVPELDSNDEIELDKMQIPKLDVAKSYSGQYKTK